MAGHVFISHGSDNRGEADALCAFIESRGVKAWIAPRDVRPGVDYSEELQKAIEGCTAFVVLVTEMANKSPYVRAETEMAFSNSKPIFPVRMSDIKPAAGLAFFLKIRHWTDAYGKGREASLGRLALELQTLCGIAPGPAPAPAPAPPASSAPPAPEASAPPARVATEPPAAAPEPSPADQELLAAAIEPNAKYYFERWRQVDEKGAKTSWNWAACFANLFWMAYRKMWVPLVLFLVANLVLGALGSLGPLWGRVTLLASIGLTFVTGSLGNIWYRKQVSRLVAEASGLDREAALARLRSRGGVSVRAMVVSLVLAGLLVAAAVLAAGIQVRRQLQQDQLRDQQLRNHLKALEDSPPTEQPATEDQAPEQQAPDDAAGY